MTQELAPSTVRLRLGLSYVGTRYAGWQSQRRRDTIQARLEQVFARVLRQPVEVVGAGRTDAGVHARGQVAHVACRELPDLFRLRHSLNSLLPEDIRVDRIARAPARFHARHDALSRVYEYRLHVGRKASPFAAPFVGRLGPGVPEIEPMRRAARALIGEHDFSSFCARGAAPGSRVRRLIDIRIRRRGEEIVFVVEGSGFLRHQVRNLVGTLVEVGVGRRPVASVEALLQRRDRRGAGPTAPAAGLCLVRVRYGRRAAGAAATLNGKERP